MTAAVIRRDPGNAVVAVENFARSLDVRFLVLLETIGLAGILVIYAAAPARWPFIFPFTAVACFGLWGICDRWISRLTSHTEKSQRRILRVLNRVVAATGILAALLGAYLLMGWMMGVYIS